MISLSFDLATGTWANAEGQYGTDFLPVLTFGEVPDFSITVAGLPQGISEADSWSVAVAKDWKASTSPMARTTENVACEIGEDNAVFSFVIDTQTERFLRIVDGHGEGVACSMQIVGIEGVNATPCCFITLPFSCRPALDPQAAGTLPAIEVTELTIGQISAIVEEAISSGGGDLSDYYTKEQTNGLLEGKADIVSGVVPSSQLPEATSTAYGAVKVTGTYGIQIAKSGGQSLGALATLPATDPEISRRTATFPPITPIHLNHAVTAALTDSNHITLADEQKATAQGVLGVPGLDSSGTVSRDVIPLAAGAQPGAVRGDAQNGVGITGTGWAYTVKASDNEISSRVQQYKPIVPNNLNTAVKAALTDANHLTMTAEEQATAKQVLGISDTPSSGYATEEYVDSAVTSVSENISSSVASTYATKEEVAQIPIITVDSAISYFSTNPLQNKVITNQLSDKARNVTVNAISSRVSACETGLSTLSETVVTTKVDMLEEITSFTLTPGAMIDADLVADTTISVYALSSTIAAHATAYITRNDHSVTVTGATVTGDLTAAKIELEVKWTPWGAVATATAINI